VPIYAIWRRRADGIDAIAPGRRRQRAGFKVHAVKRLEVDFHWPELGLCAEVDGPGHARPRTRRDDEARDRGLTANGRRLIRVDADARPDEIFTALRGALPAPAEAAPHEAEPLEPPQTG
jgi:very-short-patch-repair endonuclease